MKTLSSSSFFRVFDLLAGTSNPGFSADSWTIDDVHFRRERHTYFGATHCFAIEVFFISRSGRKGWELTVVKEHWWRSGQKQIVRSSRWNHRNSGSAKDILAWLRTQETLQRPGTPILTGTKAGIKS